MTNDRIQATIICPEAHADAARADAEAVVGRPTLAEGIPLIHEDDPDDAPPVARLWDLPVRPVYWEELERGIAQYGATVHVRERVGPTVSEVIEGTDMRRRPTDEMD